MAEHSNLPAPYESPWRQLGQALRSVAASLRLDLRFLWRRNRSGTLPLPAWWPQDFAALFWPLVLAAAVGVVMAALLTLSPLRGPGPGPAGSSETNGGAAPDPLASPRVPVVETVERVAPEDPVAPPGQSATLRKDAQPAPPTTPAAPAPAGSAAAPVEPPNNTLLQQFQTGDGGTLILDLLARPDTSLLQLRLSPAFEQLDPGRQRRLADTWLEHTLELGFEQLELLDGQGQQRGYRTRVGSGMILLDPTATSS